MGHPPRSAPHRRAVDDLAGPDAGPAAVDAPLDPAGALGPRSARGPRAATRPACTSSSAATGSTSTSPAVRAALAERAVDPLFALARACGRPTGTSASSTRPRPRSASSATTPGDLRAAIRRRPAPAPGARHRRGRGRRARAHAVGERRDHLRGERAPAQLRRGSTSVAGPTSPRCSTATSTTSPTSRRPRACASPPRSRPTRRSSRRSRRVAWPTATRSTRRSAGPWTASRARSPSPPASPSEPADLPPGAARQRSGALRRPGRRRLHRGQRALRRRRGDRQLPAPRRRDAGRPGQPAPAAARSWCCAEPRPVTVEGIERLDLRRHRAPGRCRRARRRPRSRPVTSTAATHPHYPAEGDRRGAGVVPQDPARQARRRPDGALRSHLGDDVVPPTSAPASPTGASAGRSSSARARPRSPVRASPRRCGALAAAPTCDVEPMLATELSGFELRDDMSDTLVVAISQSRHHHRHEPHRRPGAGARGDGRSPSSTGGTATSPTSRRRALHLRRSRRRDERRLDEGLLRADRGRLPAGSPSRRRRRGRTPPRRGRAELLAALREPSRRDGRVTRAAPASPPRPSDVAPSRRYWAIVGNGGNRIAAEEIRIKLSELCYKSIACDAHRGQEAHRPLLGAADPGVRRRPAAARTPTTWPRRSRSTGPTRRRRS